MQKQSFVVLLTRPHQSTLSTKQNHNNKHTKPSPCRAYSLSTDNSVSVSLRRERWSASTTCCTALLALLVSCASELEKSWESERERG